MQSAYYCILPPRQADALPFLQQIRKALTPVGIVLIVQIPRGLFNRTELKKELESCAPFFAALKRGSLSIGGFGHCVPLRVKDALEGCYACFQ